jgi:hypothetical protein
VHTHLIRVPDLVNLRLLAGAPQLQCARAAIVRRRDEQLPLRRDQSGVVMFTPDFVGNAIWLGGAPNSFTRS